MKLLIVLAVTVVAIVLLFLPATKKYRGLVLVGYGVCVFLFSAVQTLRTVPLMLPFYNARQQSFYQKEFADEAMYPDALLPLLVKGKTVYIKDDLDEYRKENEEYIDEAESYYPDGKYWTYIFYHQKNLQEFLKAAGADVVADDSFNDAFIDGDNAADFELAGYTNDMNRYLFPLSEEREEWSNSFYYYWYYSTYLDEMDLMINTDGILDADELVILCDDKENESWYVMSKDYYDTEVAG